MESRRVFSWLTWNLKTEVRFRWHSFSKGWFSGFQPLVLGEADKQQMSLVSFEGFPFYVVRCLGWKYNSVVVSNIFYFHPYLGKIPILTTIFQIGWSHQPDSDPCFPHSIELFFSCSMKMLGSRCVLLGLFTPEPRDEIEWLEWDIHTCFFS